MRIIVIGTGYVGLITGACFANMGNSVVCIDVDKAKIQMLNNNIMPIFEPGLSELVSKNTASGDLAFDTSLKPHIADAAIIFIAVGTPTGQSGEANLEFVMDVAKQIGECITNPVIVVNKSTVPVGTADMVRDAIQEELNRRGVSIDFDVASNPEFLKEGSAVDDFMKPDRIIVGTSSKSTESMVKKLYLPFMHNHDKFITMSIRSAEMTKYAANAMLATKISFINEIANICEETGANINEVRVGIGSDNRIGYSFIYPGLGYGGSCFPKDVLALEKTAREHNVNVSIIPAVNEVNQKQRLLFAKKIKEAFANDLRGKRFAVWGLSFKPHTDDMRDAPSITIIEELTKAGAKINAYDPKCTNVAKTVYLKHINDIAYFEKKYDALLSCDALILVTEWKEFRSPDFDKIKSMLKTPIIFDGRNQYSRLNVEELGFRYYQVGVPQSTTTEKPV